jgi:hypothetical protein
MKTLKKNYKINTMSDISYNLAKKNMERDLGVLITSNLKWDHHRNNIIGKANKVLNLIKHAFKN